MNERETTDWSEDPGMQFFKEEHLDLDDAQILAEEIRLMILKKREERNRNNGLNIKEEVNVDTNIATGYNNIADNNNEEVIDSVIREKPCTSIDLEMMKHQELTVIAPTMSGDLRKKKPTTRLIFEKITGQMPFECDICNYQCRQLSQ